MSRLELLNSGQFRIDGRQPLEFRSIQLSLSCHSSTSSSSTSSTLLQSCPLANPSSPDGSSSVTHGLTCVKAYVFGPREPKERKNAGNSKQSTQFNVDVAILPWSSQERRRRAKGDRRLTDLSHSIKNSFSPILLAKSFPRSEVDVYVQVESDDGGLLPAALNATTLALIDAGLPLTDYVLGLTIGLHSTIPLIDLCSPEESSLPNLTLAILPRSKLVTLASSETRLPLDRLKEIFELGLEASQALLEEMEAALKERTRRLAESQRKVVIGIGGKGERVWDVDEGEDEEMS